MYQGSRCLTEEELGAYLEGSLRREVRKHLEQHLDGCGECLDTVVSTGKALSFTPDTAFSEVPASLVRNVIAMYPGKSRFVDAVLSLTKEALRIVEYSSLMKAFSPQPAFSLRNARAPEPQVVVLKKSFEEIDGEFVVEKVSESLCTIKVIATMSDTGRPASHLRAGLFAGKRELASYLLKRGETVFEEINPGLYAIKITGNGRGYGEIALKIE